jgi:hypothetical protein
MDPIFTQPQPFESYAPTRKRGMFGGVSIDPGGFLPGFLAGMGAPGGIQALQGYQQRLQDAQTLKQRIALAEQQRQQQFQDQIALYDYKRNNPEPTAPHYFQDNSGNEYSIGPDGKPVQVFADPLHWKFVPNGMGGVVPVDINALMNGGGLPAPGTVVPDPRKQGGPSPSGSGGFLGS